MGIYNKKNIDVALLIDNYRITGKNCYITNMDVSFGESFGDFTGMVTISLEIVTDYRNYTQSFIEGETENKIRNKRVEDCTIEELFFAIRKKISLGGKNEEK